MAFSDHVVPKAKLSRVDRTLLLWVAVWVPVLTVVVYYS